MAVKASSTSPTPKTNYAVLLISCLVALAVLWAAYSGFFHNSFHFDDSHVIETNVYIRSLSNAGKFFTDAATSSSLPANAAYRPLVTLSLAVDYWLGHGLNPRQFHITQFALLVILGALLFFFFRHLIGLAGDAWWNSYLALFMSLLYSVHTINTEALNIISARSELLSTIGIIAAFLIYFHSYKGRRYWLYLIPVAIGSLAKPPTVMFAPLLFVYLFLFEPGPKKDTFSDRFFRSLKSSLPSFVVGFALFVLTTKMAHPDLLYATTSRLDYAITQPYIWLHYIRLFFLPVGLTADTDWGTLPNWYDTRLFVGLTGIFLLTALTWRLSKQPRLKPAAFGLAWFMLTLLPASSIIPLAEVTNDHRVFLPMVGLSFAVIWILVDFLVSESSRHPQWTRSLATAFVAIAILSVGGLAWGTYERNKVWVTEEALWYDVTLKSPENGRALMNYGLSQMSKGKYAVAKNYFERALVYNPYYATLEINLGIVNSSLGDLKAAEQHFQRALSLQPRFAEGHFFYARWLQQQGRIDEAVTHLETALAISPAHMPSRELLMSIYSSQGPAQEEKLKKLVNDTLAVWPEDPLALSYSKKLSSMN